MRKIGFALSPGNTGKTWWREGRDAVFRDLKLPELSQRTSREGSESGKKICLT